MDTEERQALERALTESERMRRESETLRDLVAQLTRSANHSSADADKTS